MNAAAARSSYLFAWMPWLACYSQTLWRSNMKNLMAKFVITLATMTLGLVSVPAQDGALVSTHNSEAAEHLNLHAVAEVFKDSEHLENFEHSLNNPETGINNLDLNDDDQVDFIRVVEHVADNTHLVVLQVPLGEDEFQDVATIAVEQEGMKKYNLQIQGDEGLYGPNYYVIASPADLGTWAVVRGLFRPNRQPYRSPFGFRTLPRWWGVRHPVALNIYRTRTVAFVGRRNFVATKTVRVRTVGKVNYRPRTSTLVIRKTNVSRPMTTIAKPGTVIHSRTDVKTRPNSVTQTTTTRTNTRAGKPKRGKH
jgi:hypothetical protein